MKITIRRDPATVTHQSGTRIRNNRTYKTRELKDWETTLANELNPYKPEKPISGPIGISVDFIFRTQRKSTAGKWKTTRPDTDNMVKTLKDVMTLMKFWNDDAQVVDERVTKKFGHDGMIVIEIEEKEENAD